MNKLNVGQNIYQQISPSKSPLVREGKKAEKVTFNYLYMKSTTTKFSATLIMKLHPSTVIIKARSFPVQRVIGSEGSPHKRG